MARLNTRASTVDTLYRDRTPAGRKSPTPGASFSSDKENTSTARQVNGKRTSTSITPMAPNPQHTNKRRRLAEQGQSAAGRQTEHEEEDGSKKFYNPEQDPEERRKVRFTLRSNQRELLDRQDEFINNDGAGMEELIRRQTAAFTEVKQTSDATMDSNFLVHASNITLKRARQSAYGDSVVGIDIDEFVSKCITFMKYGRPLNADDDAPEPLSTQARRMRQTNAEDDEDDDNDGDAMAWDVLGAGACFPSNSRPAVPSFLLGPLSVEKRVRTTQRRATQRKAPTGAIAKPQELKATDLEQNENNSMTTQCARIRTRLQEVVAQGSEGIDQDADSDMDDDEARAVFKRHNLSTNYHVSLFKFAINPQSFGQTVENFFYLSFLARDGFVHMEDDEDGLPTIRYNEPKTESESRASGATKHQAIFTIDYETWQKLILALDLKRPLIAHREEEQTQVTSGAWYG